MSMSTLNDLHGKVPSPPVHVAALGFNGPWEVMTMSVRLATCRDRNVADYIAALWNLMPAINDEPTGPVKPPTDELGKVTAAVYAEKFRLDENPVVTKALRHRRRKAGKSVQVMP